MKYFPGYLFLLFYPLVFGPKPQSQPAELLAIFGLTRFWAKPTAISPTPVSARRLLMKLLPRTSLSPIMFMWIKIIILFTFGILAITVFWSSTKLIKRLSVKAPIWYLANQIFFTPLAMGILIGRFITGTSALTARPFYQMPLVFVPGLMNLNPQGRLGVLQTCLQTVLEIFMFPITIIIGYLDSIILFIQAKQLPRFGASRVFSIQHTMTTVTMFPVDQLVQIFLL